jgi:hypothetical protein
VLDQTYDADGTVTEGTEGFIDRPVPPGKKPTFAHQR